MSSFPHSPLLSDSERERRELEEELRAIEEADLREELTALDSAGPGGKQTGSNYFPPEEQGPPAAADHVMRDFPESGPSAPQNYFPPEEQGPPYDQYVGWPEFGERNIPAPVFRRPGREEESSRGRPETNVVTNEEGVTVRSVRPDGTLSSVGLNMDDPTDPKGEWNRTTFGRTPSFGGVAESESEIRRAISDEIPDWLPGAGSIREHIEDTPDWTGVTEMMLDNASLGFSDEIEAGLRSGINYGLEGIGVREDTPSYDEELRRAQESIAAAYEQSTSTGRGAAAALGMLPWMATGLGPLGRIAQSVRSAPIIARGAASGIEGTILSGLTNAGASNEPTLGGRAGAFLEGVEDAGPLNMALGGLSEVAGTGLRAIRSNRPMSPMEVYGQGRVAPHADTGTFLEGQRAPMGVRAGEDWRGARDELLDSARDHRIRALVGGGTDAQMADLIGPQQSRSRRLGEITSMAQDAGLGGSRRRLQHEAQRRRQILNMYSNRMRDAVPESLSPDDVLRQGGPIPGRVEIEPMQNEIRDLVESRSIPDMDPDIGRLVSREEQNLNRFRNQNLGDRYMEPRVDPSDEFAWAHREDPLPVMDDTAAFQNVLNRRRELDRQASYDVSLPGVQATEVVPNRELANIYRRALQRAADNFDPAFGQNWRRVNRDVRDIIQLDEMAEQSGLVGRGSIHTNERSQLSTAAGGSVGGGMTGAASANFIHRIMNSGAYHNTVAGVQDLTSGTMRELPRALGRVLEITPVAARATSREDARRRFLDSHIDPIGRLENHIMSELEESQDYKPGEGDEEY